MKSTLTQISRAFGYDLQRLRDIAGNPEFPEVVGWRGNSPLYSPSAVATAYQADPPLAEYLNINQIRIRHRASASTVRRALDRPGAPRPHHGRYNADAVGEFLDGQIHVSRIRACEQLGISTAQFDAYKTGDLAFPQKTEDGKYDIDRLRKYFKPEPRWYAVMERSPDITYTRVMVCDPEAVSVDLRTYALERICDGIVYTPTKAFPLDACWFVPLDATHLVPGTEGRRGWIAQRNRRWFLLTSTGWAPWRGKKPKFQLIDIEE